MRLVVSSLQRRLVSRVRLFAERKAMILSHLPDVADVSRSHFWDVLKLRKSPTLQWLERVAAALDVDAMALLAPFAEDDAFSRLSLDPGVMPPKDAVALLSLTAAAGAFSDPHDVHTKDWVRPKTKRRVRRSMFVAKVAGQSMEPTIPQGAYALFDTSFDRPLDDRVVLVQLREIADPENGGSYTVKRWKERKGEVSLRPDNDAFPALVFAANEAKTLSVLAEFVEVLPAEA